MTEEEMNALVPIRILSDADVRQCLDELEERYHIDSEEFYG